MPPCGLDRIQRIVHILFGSRQILNEFQKFQVWSKLTFYTKFLLEKVLQENKKYIYIYVYIYFFFLNLVTYL